ncbi:MAG: 8-oxoguanine DNA glycosylase [Chloroflexota bacterium]|nr:8-oxoguanine DNA glycosylase [Chloroflexota bacterium]
MSEVLRWDDLPQETLELGAAPLDLPSTLTCGQAFRWREAPGGWWTGVVGEAVLRARHDGNVLTYAVYPRLPAPDFWASYLRLDFDLAAMYRELAGVDRHLDYAFGRWHGLRVLRQDPTETLTTFLCTTANSIPRITRAIERMSHRWGKPLTTIDGVRYSAFPGPEVFTLDMASELERESGLGYRAHNLVSAMQEVSARPQGWATALREAPYAEARAELMSIRGIGPKLADCIALFALDKNEAVPVDTHVRQIAVELYMPELRARSLTTNAYNRVADFLRQKFGSRAGWAQQYLFYWHLTRHREPAVL